jgi:epoxyqueuosine reductase QueG
MLTAMTNMAKEVAKRIKGDGCKTKVISAAGGKWVDGDGRKEQFGYISLKHAAEIAGLGVIGKNYLLTNPQYGNLLWFSAVLTDAELMPDEKAQSTMCDNCNKCVEACPAGALDNLASFKRKGCSKFFTMEDRKFMIIVFRAARYAPTLLAYRPWTTTSRRRTQSRSAPRWCSGKCATSSRRGLT